MVLLIALSLSQASLSSFVLSDSVDAYDGGDAVWISRSTRREYICPVVSINELKYGAEALAVDDDDEACHGGN